jgi:NitT/TauT family transport system substrate-binding protein
MKHVSSRGLVRLLALSLLLAVHAPARAATTLEMAYMPIVPCSQLFVMEGMGWTRAAGIDLKLTRFPNGPAIVQAIASGKMDVMCLGIGPAMVAYAKGVNIKVIAPGIVEQIAVIAQGDLVKYFDKYPPKEALLQFAKDKGRKAKLASFPKGSVPDTVTRHWLIKMLGMSVDDVELIGMGAARVQQALLSRSVDAAGILEPILTIVETKLPDAKVVVRANGMMPKQPGSTLAVRENVLAANRDAIIKLMELHIRATKLLLEDPKAAAPHVTKFIAQGLVDEGTILKAISSRSSNFVANPRDIIESTQYMSAFQHQYKIQAKKVNTDALFDTSIYDAAIARMSK